MSRWESFAMFCVCVLIVGGFMFGVEHAQKIGAEFRANKAALEAACAAK